MNNESFEVREVEGVRQIRYTEDSLWQVVAEGNE